MEVFISVGHTYSDKQKGFLKSFEDILQAKGLSPQILGKTTFTANSPLKHSHQKIKNCKGIIVIAFERFNFPIAIEMPNSDEEKRYENLKQTTLWNHVEATMAYCHNHPILVIAEKGIRLDGLLAPNYDSYILNIPLDSSELTSKTFQGVLDAWVQEVREKSSTNSNAIGVTDITQIGIGEIIKLLKPAQLWTILGIVSALLSSTFALGKYVESLSQVNQVKDRPCKSTYSSSPLNHHNNGSSSKFERVQ